MDIMTSAERSHRMSLIRGKNTKPEILLRKHLWNRGFKGYRINSKILGKPDLFYSTKGLAIFVDGCFWHGCPRCYKPPKSNRKYWKDKVNRNKQRDRIVNRRLRIRGIRVIRIWEHSIRKNLQKKAGLLESKLL
jgi:DNA mismatch endonuclease, patch repair protein